MMRTLLLCLVIAAPLAAYGDPLPPPGSSAPSTVTVQGKTTSIQAAISNPGYSIVVCAGQSNMAGRGTLDPLYDLSQAPYVYSWDASSSDPRYQTIIDQVNPLYQTEGLMVDANGTKGVGPCGEFGKLYQETLPAGRKVLLVPVAVGGTGIFFQNQWGAPSGPLYANAIVQANAAVAAANVQYPSGNNTVDVILWGQGENDDGYSGGVAVTQDMYASAMDGIISGFRSSIAGAANALVVIGHFNPYYEEVGYSGNVAAAQRDTPRRNYGTWFTNRPDGLTEGATFDPTLYTSPTDCTLLGTLGLQCYKVTSGDSIHYSGKGARLLAAAFLQGIPYARANVAGGPAPILAPSLAVPITTATSAHLRWTYPTSPATRVSSVSVQFKQHISATWLPYDPVAKNGIEFENQFNDLNVLNLAASTAYDFRVASVNEAGTGPYSNVVTATTGSSVAAIANPTRGGNATLSGNAVIFKWTAPYAGDTPTSYVLDYFPANGAHTTITGLPAGVFAYTLSSFPLSGTQYYMRVAAADAAGQGPYNVAFPIVSPGSPLPPNAPTGVTFVSGASSSISLSWTAPAGGYPPSGYVIQACETAAPTTCFTAAQSGATTAGTIGNLPSSQSFQLTVAGTNSGGTGPYSATAATGSTSGADYPIADVGVTPYASCNIARKSTGGQTGYAINVVRSSDGANQDIGWVANSLDTVSLLTFVGTGPSNQGFVAKCYDNASGRSVNFTQTTVANMPSIVVNGALVTSAGGTPGMLITSKAKGTQSSANYTYIAASTQGLPGDADFTVAYVYQPVLGDFINNSILTASDSGTIFSIGQSNLNYFSAHINSAQPVATSVKLTAGQNHVVEMTYQASSTFVNAWVDNTQVMTNVATAAATGTLPSIGDWASHGGYWDTAPGPIISELYIWNSVLGSTPLTAYYSSAKTVYGTP